MMVAMIEKKISIIGSGWVGTALGKGFTELGYAVSFYDIVNKRLPNSTKAMNYARGNSNVSFICVPTPTTNERNDLSYLEGATKNIGNILANKDDPRLVVAKSTVVPRTTEEIVIPRIREIFREESTQR
jgi:UDPglucose 6-dehydrogenase